jgi:hypothetical protein
MCAPLVRSQNATQLGFVKLVGGSFLAAGAKSYKKQPALQHIILSDCGSHRNCGSCSGLHVHRLWLSQMGSDRSQLRADHFQLQADHSQLRSDRLHLRSDCLQLRSDRLRLRSDRLELRLPIFPNVIKNLTLLDKNSLGLD